jgi:hypothetical protein
LIPWTWQIAEVFKIELGRIGQVTARYFAGNTVSMETAGGRALRNA